MQFRVSLSLVDRIELRTQAARRRLLRLLRTTLDSLSISRPLPRRCRKAILCILRNTLLISVSNNQSVRSLVVLSSY